MANVAAMTSMADLSRLEGVEFLLSATSDKPSWSWGLEQAEPMQKWVRQSCQGFRFLGEQLEVGELRQLSCKDRRHFVTAIPTAGGELCVGFQKHLAADKIRQTLITILSKWAS